MMRGMTIELPLDGPAAVAGIALPPGRRLGPSGFKAARSTNMAPVLWATDAPAVGAVAIWASLSEALEGSGLVPVLLEGLHRQPRRPWDEGEFEPAPTAAIDGLDVAEVLGAMWEATVPSSQEVIDHTPEVIAPYGPPFPGLAAPTPSGREGHAQLARALAVGHPPVWARVGLVVARRPADVLAAVGWQGPANYEHEPTARSAVLRSWEDRFGAWVFRLGFDTLQLLVESPPSTIEAAVPIAAEQFAFCPDSVYQDAGSITELAVRHVNAPVWSFWWD
jgi:hypothetical protein